MAYWLLKAALTPVLRVLYRLEVDGADNVPSRGPVILASNHISFCDSVFLPLVVARRVTFVAKAEYFDDWRTAWFFRSIGQIPMRREGGSASDAALAAARSVLDGGGVLGIYPEGTRSPDARLYRGHTGVARLALATRAPVVAVAMIGTDVVMPIGCVRPKVFRPVVIRFSRPMTFAREAGNGDDPLVLRQATDEIMFELAQLSGQEYVDRYARRPSEGQVEGSASAEVTQSPQSGNLQDTSAA